MTGTVLITGAYGYLGSLIRQRIDRDGWTTVALVRTPRPADRASAWTLGETPDAELLSGAHALVHCAYDFRPRTAAGIWRVNVDGSSTLVRAASAGGVGRILTLSSMSAYDGTRQLYGRAKLALEKVTIDSGGIAVRPGLVYGDAAGGMVGALRKLLKLPLVPIMGGSARQFPVHEDDLAGAIAEILSAPGWLPEVIGIAQPDSITFRQVLAALSDGGRPRFVPVPWQAVFWALRLAEATGAPVPLRADSVLGLVRPAPSVPPSEAFPGLLGSMRRLA